MVDAPLAATPSGFDPVEWDAACQTVRTYCGWHIAPSAVETVTVDGSGGGVQLLPTLHLVGLADVKDAGVDVAAPEWSAAGMVRKPSGCWTAKFRGVTATMTHGYDTAPEEVLTVVSMLVQLSQRAGLTHQQTGPYSASYGDAISSSPLIRSILDRYKLPPRP